MRVVGYIVETYYGIITKQDGEYYHNGTPMQGVYLFKDRKAAEGVQERFRNKFKGKDAKYYTRIFRVLED